MGKKSKDTKEGKGKGGKRIDEIEYIKNLEERILAEAPAPGTNPLAQDAEAASNNEAAGQSVQKGGGTTPIGPASFDCMQCVCARQTNKPESNFHGPMQHLRKNKKARTQ
jgi:hypothetical protein